MNSFYDALVVLRHIPECGTAYRGCSPDCPIEKQEQKEALERMTELAVEFGLKVEPRDGVITVSHPKLKPLRLSCWNNYSDLMSLVSWLADLDSAIWDRY